MSEPEREAPAPYSFEFSGVSLWLLLDQASSAQAVIDQAASATPAYPAHCTLVYGVPLDPDQARRRFALFCERARNELAVPTGPVGLQPVELRLDNYSRFDMRYIALYMKAPAAIGAMTQLGCEVFGADPAGSRTDESDGEGGVHSTLVYDWESSARLDQGRLEWAEKLIGQDEQLVAKVALADTNGTVGSWRILAEAPLSSLCPQ